MPPENRLDELTAREREVLDLVRLGLTNEEIAGRLGITEAGAKYHVSQILSKLGVSTRDEASALVIHATDTHVAEAFQPRRGRWWAALPLAAKAVGVAVMVAVAVGLVLLAWGVLRTSDGDDGAATTATTAAPTSAPPSSVPPVLGPKELIARRMCAANEEWQRPTEDAMQALWQSPAFQGVSLEEKRRLLTESFYWYNDDLEAASTFSLLSGMGSQPSGEERATCEFEGTVELWTLQYRVTHVEYLGGTLYRVHVDPTEKGWRAVRFGRTGGPVDPTVAVVTPDQQIVRCLGNADRCDQIALDWADTLAVADRSPPSLTNHRSSSRRVEFTAPAIWEPDPSHSFGTSDDPLRYSDPRGELFGFVGLDARGTGLPLDDVARMDAEHKRKPYGEQPRTESLTIDGLDARIILPDPSRSDLLRAEVIVPYPDRPLTLPYSDFVGSYDYFILSAHKDYIRDIAQTIRFVADSPTP